MRETHTLQKGLTKDKTQFQNRDTITGKRRVQVNRNTWVYTDCKTDQEAINKFKKRYEKNFY